MERMKWVKILVTVIFTVRAYTDAQGQVLWMKAQNWKIYNGGDSSFAISIDSLKGEKYHQLNADSMRYFLDSVTLLPNNIQPGWMGVYLTTCVIEGEIRKVLISYYAGFFYDEKSRRYYQIPASKKDDWRNYLDACLISIQ
jgi:hypothetical protein